MSESRSNRFVGKNKTNLYDKVSKPKRETTQDDLLAHLKEFEEWANPAFNVLVVQTPRPAFFEAPLLRAFRDTVKETGDLLKSICRLGLPQTSVRNKLPYYRDDNSPLPTTARASLRNALSVMDYPVAPSLNLHSPAHGAIEHRQSLDISAGHGHVHGRKQKFVFNSEIPPWVILALNVGAWWFLSTPPENRMPPML